MQIILILPSNYFLSDAQKYQNTMSGERKKFPSLESLKTLTFLMTGPLVIVLYFGLSYTHVVLLKSIQKMLLKIIFSSYQQPAINKLLSELHH